VAEVSSGTASRDRASRSLIPLGLAFLASGLSIALVGPFLALFLANAVHAGPVAVSTFLVAMPIAGVVVTWAIGRLSDRRPMRRELLVVAALAGLVGSALTAVIRDYWLLLALATTVTAVAGALFPQTFAYAREVLRSADPRRAAMANSALRTVFSGAYVAGPPVAALLLSHGGFTAVYATAAVMYGVAALVTLAWLPKVRAREPHPDELAAPSAPAAGRRVIWLTTAGFVLLQTPLVLGVQALALFVEHDLHGSVGSAGVILGLCAALEIPLMLGFGLLTARFAVGTLIVAGAVCGVVYEVIAVGAPAVWVLAVAQVVNAVFIASTSGLGISYMQDLMPAEPGRATTLFTNSFPVGQILAGPLLGVAQQVGYRFAYGMNAALCLLGLVLLIAGRPAKIALPAGSRP
jgi:SET family sugar efflux transporter-like MFS transporter